MYEILQIKSIHQRTRQATPEVMPASLDKRIVCPGKVCMLTRYDLFVNVGRTVLKKNILFQLKIKQDKIIFVFLYIFVNKKKTILMNEKIPYPQKISYQNLQINIKRTSLDSCN